MFVRTDGRCFLFRSSLALLGITLATAGCGKSESNPFIEQAKVKAYTQNGDAWGEVDITMNTGNVMLPALTLPIEDPKNPSKVFGTLTLKDNVGGGSELDIAVDVSVAAHIPGADGSTLPNGNPIPIGGISGSSVIGIPINHGNSRIYLAFGNNTAMIGTALVIREFDKLSGYVGGLDVFLPFTYSNVTGIAGLFTSPSPDNSGLAVFVDASSVLNKSSGTQLARVLAADLGHGLAQTRAKNTQKIIPLSIMPSYSKLRKLQKGVQSIGKHRVTIL